MELKIKKYENNLKEKWDDFVLNDSINGTFLQSRNFLEYHGNRFKDTSLIIYKGEGAIVAVVPACSVIEDNKKIFYSHCGSTFGGIIVGKSFNNIKHMDAILDILEEYLESEKYNLAVMKNTTQIFSTGNIELLSYFLIQRGYHSYCELTSYIDFVEYNKDICSNFTKGKRRDYRYSLKQGLEFIRINDDKELEEFYDTLQENLQKHEKKPVHSLEELLEFKNKRLQNIVEFYGVVWEGKIVAGSMVFNFQDRVFHTQYLASKQQYPHLFLMTFLIANLINEAAKRKFRYFSFGISTEEHGKILNKYLAQFKEEFGAQNGLNVTFIKEYD